MLISDLGKIVTGKTPLTKRKEYWDGDIPFVTPGDLQNSKHINSTSRYISEQGMLSVKGTILPKDSVCVSCIGNIGYVGKTTKTSVSNQQINSIIVNDKHNADYVYYLMKSLWRYFKNCENQSTTLSILNKTQFSKIQVVDHSREEEDRIAEFLNMLDLKIEMNTNVNDNLQLQALSIFQEWFIDNPDKTNWHQGTFSELVQSTLNGDWGKESPSGNNIQKVYCIRGADIPDVRAGSKGKMPIRYILPKNYASKMLTDGDIVIEISGGSPTQSTGRCVAVTQSLLERYDSGMVCTNFCKAIKPKSNYSMFIYYYWQYLYDKKVFFAYENGTTGIKNLDFSGFLDTETIIIPPEELVSKFNNYCKAIFDQVFANGKESEKLAEIRDYLLPRLMSGELDVSNIVL